MEVGSGHGRALKGARGEQRGREARCVTQMNPKTPEGQAPSASHPDTVVQQPGGMLTDRCFLSQTSEGIQSQGPCFLILCLFPPLPSDLMLALVSPSSKHLKENPLSLSGPLGLPSPFLFELFSFVELLSLSPYNKNLPSLRNSTE